MENRAISSVELTSFCHSLAVAGESVWGLNAFESIVSREEILDKARESDDRRRMNANLSIFDGIPISVKTNIAVATQRITAGSKILGMGRMDGPPCGYDAGVVKRLVADSGSIIVGMTSMDEFGMGSIGNSSTNDDGSARVTKNPLPLLHNLSKVLDMHTASNDEKFIELLNMSHDAILEVHQRAKDMDEREAIFSAGGSSCGSAASVAHGSSVLSLGTDTGGSVRLPSAWCGLVGLKPSYGLFSRHGVVSYASSFDTVGVLSRSVDCSRLAYEVLAQRGKSSRDSTFSGLEQSAIDCNDLRLNQDLAGIRIGIPAAFSVEEMSDSVRKVWSKAAQVLHERGAEVKEISTAEISSALVQNSLAAYYVLVSAEASSNLSRYDGFRYGVAAGLDTCVDGLTQLEQRYSAARTRGFGTEVSRRILCGAAVLSSVRFHTHYEAAAKLRAVLAGQMYASLANNVDAFLIPTALSLPIPLDQDTVDRTEMFANDIMTIPASLAGLPVLSIPQDLPDERVFKAGVSVIGARLNESTVLNIGAVLQAASPFGRHHVLNNAAEKEMPSPVTTNSN
jgi:aspartyl-tRNA(Asn)/glutamyl-tRNA(Gln) amidotransferase subunit A